MTAAAEAVGLSPEARAGVRARLSLDDPSETAFALRCDLPAEATDTLLIVDQFEEVLLRTPPTEAARFVALLLALVDPKAGRHFRIAIAIRADYFNLLARHEPLFTRLTAEGSTAQLRLGKVGPEGLEELTRKPLRMAGHADDAEADALVVAVTRDLSDRPGDLALAQMALAATWREAARCRVGLSAAYARVGRVFGTLAHEAERVQTEMLDDAERARLLSLFVSLVRLGDAGGATRRSVPLSELDPERRALAARRATEKGGRLLGATETEVEIGHEALIRQWPWLAGELTDAAPDMRELARLADAAAAWQRSGMRSTALPSEAERRALTALAARRPEWLLPHETEFIRRSKANRRRWRAFAIVTAACFTLLVGAIGTLGLIALKREAAAARQAWIAKRNERNALLALSEIALLQGRTSDSLKLALAAWPRRRNDRSAQTYGHDRILALALHHAKLTADVNFQTEDGFRIASLSHSGSRVAILLRDDS